MVWSQRPTPNKQLLECGDPGCLGGARCSPQPVGLIGSKRGVERMWGRLRKASPRALCSAVWLRALQASYIPASADLVFMSRLISDPPILLPFRVAAGCWTAGHLPWSLFLPRVRGKGTGVMETLGSLSPVTLCFCPASRGREGVATTVFSCWQRCPAEGVLVSAGLG